MEKRFQFRERLVQSNKSFKYKLREKAANEISFLSGVEFFGDDSVVIGHAKNDFKDYLNVCFGVKNNGESAVKITVEITESGLEDVNSYKGRIVETVDNSIVIRAFDERGAAQAIYDLEDAMTLKKQPYIDKGITKNKPLFSPRMVHSAYDADVYPERYLQVLAKEGIDAIMLSVTGVNNVATGHRDINAIIDLAAEYGIDVYAYWHNYVFHSPEADDAEEVYSAAFGELFKDHNKLKGIILVGENIQFPSKDPHSTGKQFWNLKNEDNFFEHLPGVSHWPCEDYVIWLDLVKSIIKREKPDADIVFWTYNWGWAPEEDRIALIDRLPTDISLLVTFEMFENLPTDYGITERVCDYSVAFAGPGKYFISEAEAAKRRGIRLYTQANSGGRTWDFGCLPFEPFPQQWMDRYQAMRECHEKYGLVGVMECHQYGFWPSMITKIEKQAFEFEEVEAETILKNVISEFSEEDTDSCIEALSYWSEAIRLYMPTDQEQYSAMRVGPAYPLSLGIFPTPPKSLLPEGSFFGNGITQEYCLPSGMLFNGGNFTLHSVRFRTEMRILRDIIKLLKKGISVLKNLKNKNEDILRLINMGEYMICCFTTDINVKKMYLYRQRLSIAPTNQAVSKILADIRKVGAAEIRNAENALKCVDFDSAIGFEPMMGYAGDRAHIEWKIRQVKHMLTHELAVYERGLNY